MLAGGSPAEATLIAESLSLVGWSHGFYGEHSDISIDMPGIERLISGEDSEQEALREARTSLPPHRQYSLCARRRFPILGSTLSTRRMQARVEEIQRYFSDADGKSSAARNMLTNTISEAWAGTSV